MDEIKKAKACSQNEPSNCANCELTDDNLENVTGGLRRDFDGKSYIVVTSCMNCKYPEHYDEYKSLDEITGDDWFFRGWWYDLSGRGQCGRCKNMKFFPGTRTGYCTFSGE